MNILIWLVVGGVIGWIASLIVGTDAQQGVLLNVIVGIVGALIGGWLISPMIGVGTINEGASTWRRSACRWPGGDPAGDRQPDPSRDGAQLTMRARLRTTAGAGAQLPAPAVLFAARAASPPSNSAASPVFDTYSHAAQGREDAAATSASRSRCTPRQRGRAARAAAPRIAAMLDSPPRSRSSTTTWAAPSRSAANSPSHAVDRPRDAACRVPASTSAQSAAQQVAVVFRDDHADAGLRHCAWPQCNAARASRQTPTVVLGRDRIDTPGAWHMLDSSRHEAADARCTESAGRHGHRCTVARHDELPQDAACRTARAATACARARSGTRCRSDCRATFPSRVVAGRNRRRPCTSKAAPQHRRGRNPAVSSSPAHRTTTDRRQRRDGRRAPHDRARRADRLDRAHLRRERLRQGARRGVAARRQLARASGPFVASTAARFPPNADRKPSCSATRRAASPGRRATHTGFFERANSGTLLLDEVHRDAARHAGAAAARARDACA